MDIFFVDPLVEKKGYSSFKKEAIFFLSIDSINAQINQKSKISQHIIPVLPLIVTFVTDLMKPLLKRKLFAIQYSQLREI